jgi:hypothetical protein
LGNSVEAGPFGLLRGIGGIGSEPVKAALAGACTSLDGLRANAVRKIEEGEGSFSLSEIFNLADLSVRSSPEFYT